MTIWFKGCTFSIILLVLLWIPNLNAAVVAKPVEYEAENVKLEGYLAYDFGVTTKRPGILVIHEWWGHDEYARKRAQMLAELGYTAFALDMYGKGKLATHPAEAGEFSGEVKSHLEIAQKRFKAALTLLRSHRTVDPNQIAVIGYCFGGGVALEMARRGYNVNAVVSFHGSLATEHPVKPGMMRARILVCQGEDDSLVTAEEVEKFEKEMKMAKANYKIITYPGAKHSFTNPKADELAQTFGLPIGYNLEADGQSWDDMQVFLTETFTNTKTKTATDHEEEKVGVPPEEEESELLTGTVHFINVAGGFFGIIGDDSKHYEPINLAADFQNDGMKIQFKIKVDENIASFRMWGTPVRILSISATSEKKEQKKPSETKTATK